MIFFSIVMIPLAVFLCIGFVFSIAMSDETPATRGQEGDLPIDQVESIQPAEVVRLD
jgi:hypothetical protein